MTCRHCHEAIRPCDCGRDQMRHIFATGPHWVGCLGYPSRWCRPASLDRTHEPEETHHG